MNKNIKNKYRVRLSDNRVIGPFHCEQIAELIIKKRISGAEYIQQFPLGNWQRLASFPEIINALKGSFSNDDLTDILLMPNADEELQNAPDEIIEQDEELVNPQEFNDIELFDNSQEIINKEELEKQYQKKQHDNVDENQTIIKKVKFTGEDKTVINEEAQRELKKFKEKIEKKNQDSLNRKNLKLEKTTSLPVDLDEATQMINYSEVADELQQNVIEEEQKLRKWEDRKLSESYEELNKVIEEEKIVESEKKKSRPIILGVAFFLIAYLLFFDDKEPVADLKPLWPNISFIQPYEVYDVEKAKESYQKGMTFLNQNNYLGYLNAAREFKSSVENKQSGIPESNESLAKLAYTYGHLIEAAKDKIVSGKELFDLLRLIETKSIYNIYTVKSKALFFMAFEKPKATINIIENYLRTSSDDIDQELLSIYLRALIQTDEEKKAQEVFLKLQALPTKEVQTYVSILDYYYNQQDFKNVLTTSIEGLKKFPESIPLMFQYSKYLIETKDKSKLQQLAKDIKSNRMGYSPIYYSRYLELEGMIFVMEGKYNEASLLFRKSLELFDSSELRSKIAAIDNSKDTALANILLENQALELMKKSRMSLNEKLWDKGMLYAIQAADLFPGYIPAQIYLSKVQTSQGYLNKSIETLDRLRRVSPFNILIDVELINSYITAYKFDQANTHLALIAQKAENNYMFSYLMSKLFLRGKDYISGLMWLDKAIDQNPINAEMYYLKAKTLVEIGGDDNYEAAKRVLSKAFELDPSNLDYNILYASILYSLDGVDVANGYLRDLLTEYPDNAQIIGEMAIYYSRSGQIKLFEDYKKQVQKLEVRDRNFFSFLAKISKIEGNNLEYEKYAKKLIDVDPGNIDAVIDLGKFYLDDRKFNLAIETFETVRSKLDSYPLIHYYISSAHFLQGDMPVALSFADDEIKKNPRLEKGYLLKGKILMEMSLRGDNSQSLLADANSNLEKALSIRRDSDEVLFTMGRLKLMQNYQTDAFELLQKLIRVNPHYAEAYKLLAQIFVAKGQRVQASDMYRKYLEINPDATDKGVIQSKINSLR